MPEANTIEHSGVVQSIHDTYVEVKIIAHPACAGCAASNICDVSGKNEKIIRTVKPENVEIGEEVLVIMSQEQGFRALFLGYLLPFILVMFILITLISFKVSELIAGITALTSLIPYYLGVYLRKEKIGKKFSFLIKKQIK